MDFLSYVVSPGSSVRYKSSILFQTSVVYVVFLFQSLYPPLVSTWHKTFGFHFLQSFTSLVTSVRDFLLLPHTHNPDTRLDNRISKSSNLWNSTWQGDLTTPVCDPTFGFFNYRHLNHRHLYLYETFFKPWLTLCLTTNLIQFVSYSPS